MRIADVYKKVMETYAQEGYDHRRFIAQVPEAHKETRQTQMTEMYRVEYACFKLAVAAALQVNSIVEIGVRAGVSALAFLHARKEASYVGIDNNADSKADGVDYCANAKHWFDELGFNARLVIADSQTLEELPNKPDFVHIDGDHSRKATVHDITIAIRSGAEWILVDDAAYPTVCCGLYDAVFWEFGGISPPMCRFDQTYGQSVLIHTKEDK